MQRKFIYLIVAVLVGMCVLMIETCRHKCPPVVDVTYHLDSLQYLHEVNTCKLLSIKERSDTIVKVSERIRYVTTKVNQITLPKYGSDSLTLLLTNLINN